MRCKSEIRQKLWSVSLKGAEYLGILSLSRRKTLRHILKEHGVTRGGDPSVSAKGTSGGVSALVA